MSARFIYLHGFASGPASRKARFFKEKLEARGGAVLVPDLAPDFEHTTITDQLARAVALLGDSPVILVGSSMGGYISALAAAGKMRERIRGLVLLAPAFRLAERWKARMEPLHYGFLEDAGTHPPLPSVKQPVIAFAGTKDTLVEVPVVREFCEAGEGRELVVVEADHDLVEALDEIWSRTASWLDRLG